MLDEIRTHIGHISEIAEIELAGIKELAGTMLSKFCENHKFNNLGKIYYNTTNIVFTEQYDYDQFMALTNSKDQILRLELEEFNCYLFIIRYSNSPELKLLLKETIV